MAQTIQPNMARTVAAPQHYVPPSTRELRAQTVHRLLIGLSGLAGMLLLVSLANIIMNRAQQSDRDGVVSSSPVQRHNRLHVHSVKQKQTSLNNDELGFVKSVPLCGVRPPQPTPAPHQQLQERPSNPLLGPR